MRDRGAYYTANPFVFLHAALKGGSRNFRKVHQTIEVS